MDSSLIDAIAQSIQKELVRSAVQCNGALLGQLSPEMHEGKLNISTIRDFALEAYGEFRESSLKKEIVETCRYLQQKGFFPGTSGNVSIRLDDNRFLITPSGQRKDTLSEESLISVDREGNILCDKGRASSELKMHLFSYSRRSDINAIVHAHPPFSTGFAAAGIPLDRPVLPEAILILGSIPLVEYGTPSTWEVPLALEPYLSSHDTFLLSNHGALTLGRDLREAAHRMETLELFAQVVVIARMLGGEKLLTKAHLEKLAEAHRNVIRFPDP